jgi:hypothetical protein
MYEEVWWENCDILVVEVCLISGAWFVNEFKVKLGYLWQVVHHTVANLLGVVVVFQV